MPITTWPKFSVFIWVYTDSERDGHRQKDLGKGRGREREREGKKEMRVRGRMAK